MMTANEILRSICILQARCDAPGTKHVGGFPRGMSSRYSLNGTSAVRWITQRACDVAAAGAAYVKAFHAAHATMTTSAAPASKRPTGRVAALRERIGASPLLCLISRI